MPVTRRGENGSGKPKSTVGIPFVPVPARNPRGLARASSRRVNNLNELCRNYLRNYYRARSPNETEDPGGNGPNNDVRGARPSLTDCRDNCFSVLTRRAGHVDGPPATVKRGAAVAGDEDGNRNPGPGRPRVQRVEGGGGWEGTRPCVRRSVNGERKETEGGEKTRRSVREQLSATLSAGRLSGRKHAAAH